jgi:hypothetical protein
VIVKTSKAAELCNVDASTLWRWTCNDERVEACQFKRGYYVVDKLAALGLTTKPLTEIIKDAQKEAA